MIPSTYSITLSWDASQSGYVAGCPEFPELRAFSALPAMAAAAIEAQISAKLDELHSRGALPPAPRHCVSYSGQFRLRLPRSLHAALSREAEDEGLSLNGYIQYLLASRHEQRPVRDREIDRIATIQDTVRLIQEQVASLTFTQEEHPDFLWSNESAATIALQ